MTGVFEVDWESGDVICVCGCNGVVVLVVVNLVPTVCLCKINTTKLGPIYFFSRKPIFLNFGLNNRAQ